MKGLLVVLLSVSMFMAGSCGGGGSDEDACLRLCRECPDGDIITEDSDCDNFCTAYHEIAKAAECLDVWNAGWECIDGLDACPKELSDNPCQAPEYDFEDGCIDPYCSVNPDECQAIWEQYPWN
jgi:hypothetical protein